MWSWAQTAEEKLEMINESSLISKPCVFVGAGVFVAPGILNLLFVNVCGEI